MARKLGSLLFWRAFCDPSFMEKLFICIGLVLSFSAAAGERGHRLVSSLEARHLQLIEHPEDDGNLRLLLDDGAGKIIQNDSLVAALDRDEADVASYHVSLKAADDGAVVVSSAKKWGSTNWEFHYKIARRELRYVVSGFEYSFMKRDQRKGECSLDLLGGTALVNGRTRSFEIPENSLAFADGLELQGICERLGAI